VPGRRVIECCLADSVLGKSDMRQTSPNMPAQAAHQHNGMSRGISLLLPRRVSPCVMASWHVRVECGIRLYARDYLTSMHILPSKPPPPPPPPPPLLRWLWKGRGCQLSAASCQKACRTEGACWEPGTLMLHVLDKSDFATFIPKQVVSVWSITL